MTSHRALLAGVSLFTAAVLGNACTGPAAVQALANHLIKMNMTEAA